MNSPLRDSPEYVNEDPYDEGWMMQIAVADPEETRSLMNASSYREFVRALAE